MQNDQDQAKSPQDARSIPEYPTSGSSQGEPTYEELAALAAQYDRRSSFIPQWVIDFYAAQAAAPTLQTPQNAISPATEQQASPEPISHSANAEPPIGLTTSSNQTVVETSGCCPCHCQ